MARYGAQEVMKLHAFINDSYQRASNWKNRAVKRSMVADLTALKYFGGAATLS